MTEQKEERRKQKPCDVHGTVNCYGCMMMYGVTALADRRVAAPASGTEPTAQLAHSLGCHPHHMSTPTTCGCWCHVTKVSQSGNSAESENFPAPVPLDTPPPAPAILQSSNSPVDVQEVVGTTLGRWLIFAEYDQRVKPPKFIRIALQRGELITTFPVAFMRVSEIPAMQQLLDDARSSLPSEGREQQAFICDDCSKVFAAADGYVTESSTVCAECRASVPAAPEEKE